MHLKWLLSEQLSSGQQCKTFLFISFTQFIKKLKKWKVSRKFLVVAKWLSNKRQFNVHKNLGLPVKENTLLYLENIFMIYPVKCHVYLNFPGCLFISEWAVAQSGRRGTTVWIRTPVVSENWKTGGNWLIQSTVSYHKVMQFWILTEKMFPYVNFFVILSFKHFLALPLTFNYTHLITRVSFEWIFFKDFSFWNIFYWNTITLLCCASFSYTT